MTLWLSLIGAMLAALTAAEGVAAERLDGTIEGEKWRCSLMVNPLRGEVSTTRSGGGWSGKTIRRNMSSRESTSSTKSVTRNLKWMATVRVRGEERPKTLELKVDYIGHKGKDIVYYVMQTETKQVTLDKGGKANIELTSPSATLTRKRTVSSSSGSYSSGFRSSQSTVSGQQVDGCIVRVYADGQLVRRWMSNPGFNKLAKTLK